MRLMHAITFCQSSLVMSVLGFQNCIVAIHALWSYCPEPVLILRLPLSILFACVCVCAYVILIATVNKACGATANRLIHASTSIYA